MRILIVLVVACSLSMSGCFDEPEISASDGPRTPTTEATPDLQVTNETGSLVEREVFHKHVRRDVDVAGRASHLDLWFQTDWNRTQVILVEVAWNDTVMDLDATLSLDVDCSYDGVVGVEPACLASMEYQRLSGESDERSAVFRNTGGSLGAPDSPSRISIGRDVIEIKNEQGCFMEGRDAPCGWIAGAYAKDAAADIDADVFVTVFYDGPVPEGYTAIPWSSEGGQ